MSISIWHIIIALLVIFIAVTGFVKSRGSRVDRAGGVLDREHHSSREMPDQPQIGYWADLLNKLAIFVFYLCLALVVISAVPRFLLGPMIISRGWELAVMLPFAPAAIVAVVFVGRSHVLGQADSRKTWVKRLDFAAISALLGMASLGSAARALTEARYGPSAQIISGIPVVLLLQGAAALLLAVGALSALVWIFKDVRSGE